MSKDLFSETFQKNTDYNKTDNSHKNRGLAAKIFGKQTAKWVVLNIGMNICLFLYASAVWVHDSTTRKWEPYDTEYPSGPYLTTHPYKIMLRDMYTPYIDGKYMPDHSWYRNMFRALAFAIISLGICSAKGIKKYNDAKKCNENITKIEKLIKENNVDAVVVEKMLKIAPEIVNNMTPETRVYFDMIQNGEIDISDQDFINTATNALMVHLHEHPKDAEKAIKLFEKNDLNSTILKKHCFDNPKIR